MTHARVPGVRVQVGVALLVAVLALVPVAATHRGPSPALASPAGRRPLPVTSFQGTVPPNNPPANIPPSPNFLNNCSGSSYDDSNGCVGATLQAIANGRAQEGLPPLTLPTNWTSLSAAQQLYVATNLERTARGLQPLSGMSSALDQAAVQGAQQDADPVPPGDFPWSSWGSNWAGAVGNPLEAIYFWMYDDGMGSNNIDCTPSNQSGCWGHRDNVLMILNCQPCVMGTGVDATAYQGYPSWAELLVDTSGSPSLDLAWTSEMPYLTDPGGTNLLDPDLFEFVNNSTGGRIWNAYDQTVGTGSPGMFGSPGAVADPLDHFVHLFFHGANGHLLEYVNDGKTSGQAWSAYDLTNTSGAGAMVNGDPDPVFDSPQGEIHVYVTGATGDLLEYVNDNAGGRAWNAYDVSQGAGGGSAIAGTPSGIVVGSLMHVYVRAWSGQLVEYVNDGAGGHTWNAYNQSVSAGNGSSILGKPAPVTWNGLMHVYVQGADNDLVEYVNDGEWGHVWNAYDQTAGAGAGTQIGADPSPTVVGGLLHIYVEGANGELIEYVNDGLYGHVWNAYDDSAGAGGGLPVTDRPGPLLVNGLLHVYVRGANGDLLEFVNDGRNGRVWNAYDQTASSGGPPVDADPSPLLSGGMVHLYIGAG